MVKGTKNILYMNMQHFFLKNSPPIFLLKKGQLDTQL